MLRTTPKSTLRKSSKRICGKRTNIHVDPKLVSMISSRTSLKSQRAVVDFALRTTAEMLERRARIDKMANSAFGLTKGTGIFPSHYADVIRGK
jgi:Arc/MetJ family transcription regulator